MKNAQNIIIDVIDNANKLAVKLDKIHQNGQYFETRLLYETELNQLKLALQKFAKLTPNEKIYVQA